MSIRTELMIYALLLLIVLASAGRTMLINGLTQFLTNIGPGSRLVVWGASTPIDEGGNFDALMSAGRYQEALQLVDRHLAISQNRSDDYRGTVLVARGRALLKLNRLDDALAAFDSARRLSREPDVCLYQLQVLQLKGDQLRIISCINAFFNSSGKMQPGIYSIMIRALHATGQYDQARLWADRGKGEFPDDAQLASTVANFTRDNRAEAGMQETYDSRFHIRFTDVPEQEAVRGTIVAVLKESADAICPKFRYNFDRQAEVVLYPSSVAFTDGSGAPAWAGADYDGRIRIPVTVAQSGNQVLRRVVQHEFTHFVVDQVTSRRCPGWLHEGLAQLIDGTDTGQARELTRQASGQLIDLSELDRGFAQLTDTDRVRLAYAESLLAAQFISDRYGFDRFNEILSELARGTSPADALRSHIDLSYAQLSQGAFGR